MSRRGYSSVPQVDLDAEAGTGGGGGSGASRAEEGARSTVRSPAAAAATQRGGGSRSSISPLNLSVPQSAERIRLDEAFHGQLIALIRASQQCPIAERVGISFRRPDFARRLAHFEAAARNFSTFCKIPREKYGRCFWGQRFAILFRESGYSSEIFSEIRSQMSLLIPERHKKQIADNLYLLYSEICVLQEKVNVFERLSSEALTKVETESGKTLRELRTELEEKSMMLAERWLTILRTGGGIDPSFYELAGKSPAEVLLFLQPILTSYSERLKQRREAGGAEVEEGTEERRSPSGLSTAGEVLDRLNAMEEVGGGEVEGEAVAVAAPAPASASASRGERGATGAAAATVSVLAPTPTPAPAPSAAPPSVPTPAPALK